MRVGFVLRSAEIKPLFFDLFTDQKNHFDCHSTFVMNLIAQFGAPPLEYLYSYLLKESWVVVFAYFLVLFQNARGKETQWVHEVYMHSTAQSHLALCFLMSAFFLLQACWIHPQNRLSPSRAYVFILISTSSHDFVLFNALVFSTSGLLNPPSKSTKSNEGLRLYIDKYIVKWLCAFECACFFGFRPVKATIKNGQVHRGLTSNIYKYFVK